MVSAPKARPPKDKDFLVNLSLLVSLELSEQQTRALVPLHSSHKVDSLEDFSVPKPRLPSRSARVCKAWANRAKAWEVFLEALDKRAHLASHSSSKILWARHLLLEAPQVASIH